MFTLADHKILKVQDFVPGEVIDWGVQMVMAPLAWKFVKGDGVKVAVLDTGVDVNHPDLKENILCAANFTTSDRGDFVDRHGHGTHVAGIIAGTDNGRGVVGVAPKCKLVIAKVLGDDGRGELEWIAAGLLWALEQEADIISMSLGTSSQLPDEFHSLIKTVVDAGAVVVAAAGNESGRVGYPAAYEEVIAVTAVDPGMDPAVFTNRGPEAFVSAPGVDILSTFPPARYAVLSGTSMAAPVVSGVLALYLALAYKRGLELRPGEVKQCLAHAAVDLGPEGRDDTYGFGLINAVKLLKFKRV
ncbi:MAG: S8 family peptidase [Bacillota bacterium]